MNMPGSTAIRPLLIRALLEPECVAGLDPRGWNDLLTQARKAGLHARLAELLTERGLLASAPFKARSRLRAAAVAAASTQTAVRFELDRVRRALKDVDTPIILLKGSAYVMAGLPAARGRFVGDLDIMVPRERIDAVERTLIERGWGAADLDDYDQNFYRVWSHEIPPLQHPERETPIDIHHSIAQLTSRVHPDAAQLLAAAVPLGDPRLRVLEPADMVLHSCVHLINDEVGMPLRDLFDLHDLMVHFGTDAGFWTRLLERARLHGLARPVYHMVRQARRILGTPIPDEVVQAVSSWGPPAVLQPLMDWLWARRFLPEPGIGISRRTALANWLLYIRAHWLRMPPWMLARHLSTKAWRMARQGS